MEGLVSLLTTAAVFLAIISVLVLVHEFGHFIAARWAGIAVEEFALGLPFTKPLWSKRVSRGTPAGMVLSLYPVFFGGFVKLKGEEDTEKDDDPHSFASKPVGKRFVVVIAGILMNVLLGVVLFTVILGMKGWQAEIILPPEIILPLEHRFLGADVTRETLFAITSVLPGSPAQRAGIKAPISVAALDGQTVDSLPFLQTYIKERADKPIRMTLKSLQTGALSEAVVTPKADTPTGDGKIGITIDGVTKATLSYGGFPRVLVSGALHSYNRISYSAIITGKIVSYAIAVRDARPIGQTVAGPIGIGGIVSDVLRNERDVSYSLLELLAFLSLSLGVLNVLPIPALDGGRLLFLVGEAIAGRRVLPKVEIWAHRVGMLLLLCLIILITYNDVLRLLEQNALGETLDRFLP